MVARLFMSRGSYQSSVKAMSRMMRNTITPQTTSSNPICAKTSRRVSDGVTIALQSLRNIRRRL
jgi:hypothetical protein